MKPIKYDPTNKYAWCYCSKNQVILLGWGINTYANVIEEGVNNNKNPLDTCKSIRICPLNGMTIDLKCSNDQNI